MARRESTFPDGLKMNKAKNKATCCIPGCTSVSTSTCSFASLYMQFIDRIEFEDELPPSVDALWRHWQRTCWVSSVWSQATCNALSPPNITKFGWMVEDGRIQCDWDSSENIQRVRNLVGLFIRGCKCTKGCTTKLCRCVKKGVQCGPSCNCKSCQNLPSGTDPCTQNEVMQVEEEELLCNGQRRLRCGEELTDDEDGDVPDEMSSDEKDD